LIFFARNGLTVAAAAAATAAAEKPFPKIHDHNSKDAGCRDEALSISVIA
jgi:hypothetical protein